MSSPGIRPRNNKPAIGPESKKGSQQSLRVLSEDGAARAAVPSIAMPRAKTELSELLAGDALLCVRRPAPATRQNASAGLGEFAADAVPQAESPAALSAKQRSRDGQDSLPRSLIADEGLGRVHDAWPCLPRNVRAAILAMIRETAPENA